MHPARSPQGSAPPQEYARDHDYGEDRSQAYHDVVAVIEQGDIVGTIRFREGVQTFHFRVPAAIGEEAQHLWYVDRIVDLLLFLVGLAENDEWGAGGRLPKRFHRGERRRLILADEASLAIAGWPHHHGGE